MTKIAADYWSKQRPSQNRALNRAGQNEALIKTETSVKTELCTRLKPGQTKDNVKVEPRQKPSPEQNSGLVETEALIQSN